MEHLFAAQIQKYHSDENQYQIESLRAKVFLAEEHSSANKRDNH